MKYLLSLLLLFPLFTFCESDDSSSVLHRDSTHASNLLYRVELWGGASALFAPKMVSSEVSSPTTFDQIFGAVLP